MEVPKFFTFWDFFWPLPKLFWEFIEIGPGENRQSPKSQNSNRRISGFGTPVKIGLTTRKPVRPCNYTVRRRRRLAFYAEGGVSR